MGPFAPSLTPLLLEGGGGPLATKLFLEKWFRREASDLGALGSIPGAGSVGLSGSAVRLWGPTATTSAPTTATAGTTAATANNATTDTTY